MVPVVFNDVGAPGASFATVLVLPITQRPGPAKPSAEFAFSMWVWCCSLRALEMASEVAAGVARFAAGSVRIAEAWRERLSIADIRLVERVLEGSPLAKLWRTTR